MLTSTAGKYHSFGGGGIYEVEAKMAEDLINAGYAIKAPPEGPDIDPQKKKRTTAAQPKAKTRKTRAKK